MVLIYSLFGIIHTIFFPISVDNSLKPITYFCCFHLGAGICRSESVEVGEFIFEIEVILVYYLRCLPEQCKVLPINILNIQGIHRKYFAVQEQ